jgi:hypothetical protein
MLMCVAVQACVSRRYKETGNWHFNPVPYGRGLQPRVRVPATGREHIVRNRMNLGPGLILALTKIRPRTVVLTCQKQAPSSH